MKGSPCHKNVRGDGVAAISHRDKYNHFMVMAFEVLSPKSKLFELIFYIEKCLYQSRCLRLFAVKRMHVSNFLLSDERPIWQ